MDFSVLLNDKIFVVLFYVIIFFLIIKYRKKLEIQSKVIFLYKTKWGLKLMDRFSKPLSKQFDTIGRFIYFPSMVLSVASACLLAVNAIAKLFLDNFFSDLIVIFISRVFYVSFIILFISIVIFRQFKKAGLLGIYVGYAGMILISVFLFKGFFDILFHPEAPPVLSPVIPGVQIPGSAFAVPFWYGIISLFIVVVIHEFSHGLMCRVHNIKVNSSGIGLLAVLPLAFVDPDENSLKKASADAQNSMFAAGPFSNILSAIIFLLLISFVFVPLAFLMIEDVNGIYFFSREGTPAFEAGIGGDGYKLVPLDVLSGLPVAVNDLSSFNNPGVLITTVAGVNITSYEDFLNEFQNVTPGEILLVGNNEESFSINTGNNSGVAYLGVDIAVYQLKQNSNSFFFGSLLIFLKLLFWIFTLSLGLGLANLMPIGITDGGRMLYLSLKKRFSKERAFEIFKRTTALFLTLVLILVFVPIIKALIGV